MRAFLHEYVARVRELPRNLGFYLMLALILSGGHSPLGKVFWSLSLVVIVPLIQIFWRVPEID